MKVENYLKTKCGAGDSITFIKARARKDAHSPFYHEEYQTTPIGSACDWLNSDIKDYIILNDNQMPIEWLSGCSWSDNIKRGFLKCMLIISPEDFELVIQGKKQRESIEEYIDKRIESEDK